MSSAGPLPVHAGLEMDTSRQWLWLCLWCALLLPLAVLFPPIPIDETRYLTTAWDMYRSGQWLVPMVNGTWYSDKPPLLFWLIAGGWTLFGVYTWVARVGALAISACVLLSLRRLAVRLGLSARQSDAAMWLLAGSLALLTYAVTIMFDLLLTLSVLAALHAMLSIDQGRRVRGTIGLGAAIGFGILAKGPVMLLDIAGVVVLAPLWRGTAREDGARWYGAILAGLAIGAIIAACWVVPAALYAGPGYWQPLLGKVIGRVANSFAHARPWWWYLPLVPMLMLPWLVVLNVPLRQRLLRPGRVGRFALCWWVPPFIAFCLISGKQIHYLLPLLPAGALAAAGLPEQVQPRLRRWVLLVVGMVLTLAIVAVPWIASAQLHIVAHPAIAILAVVPVLATVVVQRKRHCGVRAVGLWSTASLAALIMAGVLALLPMLDVRPAAAFVRHEMNQHVAMVHVGQGNGLFGYTGRLRQPLTSISPGDAGRWARAHPGGIMITTDHGDEPAGATPLRTWPYLLSGDHHIAAWSATAVINARQ